MLLEPKCSFSPKSHGPEAGKYEQREIEGWAWTGVVLTSRCPLCTAWCRALRPLLSATLRLLNRGARASAHLVARLAAATCSGVCHSLSRAFTSAECASSSPSTFCGRAGDRREDRGGAGGRAGGKTGGSRRTGQMYLMAPSHPAQPFIFPTYRAAPYLSSIF